MQIYNPSLVQIKEMVDEGNLIAVYREINADLETPVSAYLKIARPPYSFLLESIEGGERIARYSFIGTEPAKVIKTGPHEKLKDVDPLQEIEKELSRFTLARSSNLGRFNGGAVGYLSYESAMYFEQLPSPDEDALDIPESVFMMTSTFLIFDHLRHKIRVVSHVITDDEEDGGGIESAYAMAITRIDDLVGRLDTPLQLDTNTNQLNQIPNNQIESNLTKNEFEQMVNRIKRYIVEGDVIQTVPSQRLARPTSAAPFEIYRALRAINPSPYMYYLNLEDFQIVGASPEMLVQVENGIVATNPIAGTRPRGHMPEEDANYEKELRTSEKEKAEHIMLVDLGRNDIGKVSIPGTVRVTNLMDVERYSHVMHLVSSVSGELRDDLNNYDALRACFPAGTVSGAPKIRAMEIIAELEPSKRGVYAGAVGYFDYSGNMDTAIAIRTLVLKNGVAYAQAGGGIVFDSEPQMEYEETLHKAGALLRAIEQAESG